MDRPSNAAQRSGEQLVEGVRDRAHLSGEIAIGAAKPFGHRFGGVGDETGDIGERGFVERSGGDLFDRREHRCVLELGEGPLEHRADERGAHLSSAEDLAVFGLVFRRGTRGKGVDGGGAAGAELHRGETEVLGEGRVLPLGIRDADPPPVRAGAVDRGLPPQEALDERGLAVAGLAEHPSVRVRDEPGGVGLERVPAELASTGEEVETDVGAPVTEGTLHAEGVDAGDVCGGALVVAEPQRWPGHDARRVEGARPSGSAAAQPRSWRASRTRRSMPLSRASCSMISECSSRSSRFLAETVTSPA